MTGDGQGGLDRHDSAKTKRRYPGVLPGAGVRAHWRESEAIAARDRDATPCSRAGAKAVHSAFRYLVAF